MAPKNISTFVFLDLETTNLPDFNCNKANITEIAMVACRKEDILEHTENGKLPRAKNKLVLCFNPAMMISMVAEKHSGLNNYMLEHHNKFDVNAIQSVITFVNHQSSPVCLLAHNGEGFDFPLLKKSMEKHNLSFPDDTLCCDTLLTFRELDKILKVREEKDEEERRNEINAAISALQEENEESTVVKTADKAIQTNFEEESLIENQEVTEISLWQLLCEEKNMKKLNESTPKRPTERKDIRPHKLKSATIVNGTTSNDINQQQFKSKRSLFPSKTERKPYSLPNLYERRFGRKPEISHEAEEDVIALMKVAMDYGKDFIAFVENNSIPFFTIKSKFR